MTLSLSRIETIMTTLTPLSSHANVAVHSLSTSIHLCPLFFFFNDTATTKIYTRPYTLSLHDALPISAAQIPRHLLQRPLRRRQADPLRRSEEHTSELQSHGLISYAVFCLKKKKNNNKQTHTTHKPPTQ